MTVNRLSIVLLVLSATTTALLLSARVAAQTVVLEEIVVTARKTEESLLDSPVSVSVLTTRQLQDLNIDSIDDVAKFSPGFSFSKAFGRSTERPVIRGAANILAGTNPQAEAGSAYFIDGIYYSGDIQALDINEVARVEVIKGPQSALYGRNTYAGAVNFITEAPYGVDGIDGSVKATVGDYGEQRINGNIAFGGERAAMRLSASLYDYDGEYTNLTTRKKVGDESTDTYSLLLAFKPGDNSELSFRYNRADSDDGTRALQLIRADANNCYPGYRSNAYRNTPSPTDIRRGTEATVVNADNTNQYFCGEVKALPYVRLNDRTAAPGALPEGVTDTRRAVAFSGVERETDWFSLQYSVDFDVAIFKLSGAWRDEVLKTGSDSDHWDLRWYSNAVGAPAPTTDDPNDLAPSFFNFSGTDKTEDTSLEIRFTSNTDEALNWTLGAFYYDQDKTTRSLNFNGDANFADEFKVKNLALFTSLGYQFTDTFAGTIEVRGAGEEKSLLDRSSSTTITKNDSETFSSFTWRATLDWQLSDNTLLYGILATGNKPGGLNNSDAEAEGFADFEEETSDNIEIGVKTTFWDGRASLSLAAYYNDISKFQLTTPLADPNGLLASAVSNQGDAEVTGLELELRLALSEAWGLDFGATLSDPEITHGCDPMQFILTSGGYQPGTAAADITEGHTHPDGSVTTLEQERAKLAAGNCSIAGQQIPLTSKVQWNGAVNFDYTLGAMALFGNLNANFESSKFAQVHNGMETGDALEIGLTLGLRGDNWTVKLFGKNLNDEDAPVALTRWGDYGQGSNAAYASNFATGCDFSRASFGNSACYSSNVPTGMGDAFAPIADGSSGVRAPFVSLRDGRTWGLTAEFRF